MSSIAFAQIFGFNSYNIDKNLGDITKYSASTYGIYIDYNLSGAVQKSFNNYCIIQKDSGIYLPLECKKDKNGIYVTDYIKMFIVINVDNNTSCILNLYYYDNKDDLLQQRPLTNLNKCNWESIPATSSIDEARKFILKNVNNL